MKEDTETTETSEDQGEKRFCEAGPSDQMTHIPADRPVNITPIVIEMLEFELQQQHLNVQEIGRIIAEGMFQKTLNDAMLKELTRKHAKNVPSMANINIWSLSEDLSKGAIDSRLVVIGNAFLWNLLKTSMSTVRDKFSNYHFKMTTLAATTASLSTNSPIEFLTTRVRNGEHVVEDDSIFKEMDLLDVYNTVVFRKTGDLQSRAKQFIKCYLAIATQPKCAVWHYSLRHSGASHKKWLQNIPEHVLTSLLRFLLSLAGLGSVELEQEEEGREKRGRFFMSLGDSNDVREATFASVKLSREQLVSKFRQCITDALNETREMPYNIITRDLMAPPRGKPIDNHHCVTWRQYENLIRRCETDPSKENLEAKQDLDYKLMLTFQHRGEEEEVDIVDVEGEK